MFGRLKTIAKGFADAIWTPSDDGAESGGTAGLSMAARRGRDKSLTPIESDQSVIAVYAAVDAIARNISKAHWRVFDRDGNEDLDGPLTQTLKRPNPSMGCRQFTYELLSWHLLLGEYAASRHLGSQEGGKQDLYLLAPHRLQVEKPEDKRVRGRQDVQQWRYSGWDGQDILIRDDHVVFNARFNPTDPLRGLSPLIVGQLTASTIHSTGQYNKNYFDNGAIPSHVIQLGEGVPRKERLDFERKYLSEYSLYHSNAFKAMVVSGSDVKVHPLEQPLQEGAFMELGKWDVQQIAMLFKVPAIEIGIYDKTRFDTAAEERKQFMESTLQPEMDNLSEVFQYQVAEHFRYTAGGTKKKPGSEGSRKMKEAFTKAMDQREDSKWVVLLDPDTMPIMGDVNLARAEHAEKLRETFLISPREAEKFVGLEFDEGNPERDDIYCPKTHQNITHPEKNPEFMLAERQAEAKAKAEAAKPKPSASPAKKKELTLEERKKVKAVERFYREFRRLILKRLDGDQLFDLTEADELAQKHGVDEDLKKQIRLDRHAIRELRLKHPTSDVADAVKSKTKSYLNGLDLKAILALT
jgi:HK97 family phage portal protein